MTIIKECYVDQLYVRVFDTQESMGCCAGREAADHIKALLKQKNTINVMFAAAPSQNETLASLTADPDIDWARINAFHMDEYIGLDPAHPACFRNFLKRSIFDLKNFKSVNLLNGNADNPEAEASRYTRLLCEHPLDVCLLGIGENGHIAFNDPPIADFNDPKLVKIVRLEQRCRQQQVHDGCFQTVSQVPTHALSVTITGLMQAAAMFCSVPRATKAEAVQHMLNNTISTICPATILRRHSCAKLYIDAAAGQYVLT